MSANSHNVSFEEAENRKAWEEAELHPDNDKYPNLRNIPSLNSGIFPKNVGLPVKLQTVRPIGGDAFWRKSTIIAVLAIAPHKAIDAAFGLC
jgi:hypothetical protein